LGQYYTPAMDMWSVGCIIAELKTGTTLFKGKDDRDQLYAIFEYTGIPSINMLSTSKRVDLFFDVDNNFKVRPSENSREIGKKSLRTALKS